MRLPSHLSSIFIKTYDYRLLEEKKKQAEEFYKSDSGGEESDDDHEWTPDKMDEASKTEEDLNSSVATEKTDEYRRTEKHINSCTEEKGEPLDTEEKQNLCIATHLINDDTLPDLATPLSELSTQITELQDNCSESLPVTNQSPILSEDEGIGISEKNTLNDLSLSLNSAIPENISSNQNNEDSFPAIACLNDKTEALQNEGVKEDVIAIGSGDGEEAINSAEVNDVSKEENSDKDQLKTPKLNLLVNKLPEEEFQKIMAVTPRLSLGKEGDVIDLEETSTPSQDPGMDEFIKRFVRHSSIKQKPAEKQHVNLK